MQAKFYRKNDLHAKYGTKLDKLIWKCVDDEKCEVVDEVFQQWTKKKERKLIN